MVAGLDSPASWLIGQFDLADAPRWGATPADRPSVPQTHTIAIMLQNQDENRNVWSTVEWSDFVNASSVLELDPVHGKLGPFLDDSPWQKGQQIAIDAGGARLLVLQCHGVCPPPPPPPLPPLPPPPPPPPPPPVKTNIDTFGYYWAMQDGGNNNSDGRNCTGDCAWSHATSAFVQNSWKHPERWSSGPSSWDLSDCAQLALHNVSCIVSVSHVFLAGPLANTTLPDFEANWNAYLLQMQPVLQHVRAWYPSDEPDLRMPAATLQAIVDVLKRDTPHIDVLVTLSNLAVEPTHSSRQFFNLSEAPANADIVTFDMYCDAPAGKPACQSTWSQIEAKLGSLAAFAAAHPGMKTAVIPDATAGDYAAIGGSALEALNNRFLLWCSAREACVAVLPFVGGHWADVQTEGVAYEALQAMGDATRSKDWRGTAVGATAHLKCPMGGELVHIACVDFGCDNALLPLVGVIPRNVSVQPGQYSDECDATESSGIVDASWTCCKR